MTAVRRWLAANWLALIGLIVLVYAPCVALGLALPSPWARAAALWLCMVASFCYVSYICVRRQRDALLRELAALHLLDQLRAGRISTDELWASPTTWAARKDGAT